eukprot:5577850-Pleurochrysis_carterae.AAC.1
MEHGIPKSTLELRARIRRVRQRRRLRACDACVGTRAQQVFNRLAAAAPSHPWPTRRRTRPSRGVRAAPTLGRPPASPQRQQAAPTRARLLHEQERAVRQRASDPLADFSLRVRVFMEECVCARACIRALFFFRVRRQ